VAAKFAAGFTPKAREVLGRTLALPESVFDLLPQIGAWPSKDRPDDGPGWTFPERDAKGNVVGISERHFKTGHKPRMAGGRMGLHIPDGWCERPGAVYLVEGLRSVHVDAARMVNGRVPESVWGTLSGGYGEG
jgi:hypothetical protein